MKFDTGDYSIPGGGRFELKAKIDPRGLTGVSRPEVKRYPKQEDNEGCIYLP